MRLRAHGRCVAGGTHGLIRPAVVIAEITNTHASTGAMSMYISQKITPIANHATYATVMRNRGPVRTIHNRLHQLPVHTRFFGTVVKKA